MIAAMEVGMAVPEPVTRYRFNVNEYHRMAEAGILTEDSRVELIDGEIIAMTAIGPRHASRVGRLNDLFLRTFGDSAQIWPQNPIHLSEYDEPQPDLVLLAPRADFYASGHPTAQDVLLLVEIADASVVFDRQVKMALYARRGITEAWLFDLTGDVLLVHLDPAPTGYRTIRTLRRGEVVAPAAFPDRQLAVDDLLG